MSKPLTWEEIRQTSQAIREVFEFVDTLRRLEPMAKHVQNPKISPRFSESLVFRLIEEGVLLGHLNPVRLGGGADIVAKHEGNQVLIEVKATGESAFQYFGPKDITCDCLSWVHFGRFFHDADSPVRIYVLEKPRRIFDSPVKITLDRFVLEAGSNLQAVELAGRRFA